VTEIKPCIVCGKDIPAEPESSNKLVCGECFKRLVIAWGSVEGALRWIDDHVAGLGG
jgi:hypothetical protein